MEKYQIIKKVGNGNFSIVYLVKDKENGQLSAMKVMTTHISIANKEAELLKVLNHPNIVKLKNYNINQEGSQVKMILQFMPESILELYQAHQYGLNEEQVKCILFQAALALTHVHYKGYIHRDIKPENILIDKTKAEIKIIDFGLSINSNKISTDYVATRWYRAPQNLLGTKQYETSIDIFSLACVIVEIYLGYPLFPGTNNVDQLFRIFNVMGFPTEESWPKGFYRLQKLQCQMNYQKDKNILVLKDLLKACSKGLVSLIERMLVLNPAKRIKGRQIINDPYFHDIKNIIPPAIFSRYQHDHVRKVTGKEAIMHAEEVINITKSKLKNKKAEKQQNQSLKINLTSKTQHVQYKPQVIKNSSINEPINLKNSLSFRGFNVIKTNSKQYQPKQKISFAQIIPSINSNRSINGSTIKQIDHNSSIRSRQTSLNKSKDNHRVIYYSPPISHMRRGNVSPQNYALKGIAPNIETRKNTNISNQSIESRKNSVQQLSIVKKRETYEHGKTKQIEANLLKFKQSTFSPPVSGIKLSQRSANTKQFTEKLENSQILKTPNSPKMAYCPKKVQREVQPHYLNTKINENIYHRKQQNNFSSNNSQLQSLIRTSPSQNNLSKQFSGIKGQNNFSINNFQDSTIKVKKDAIQPLSPGKEKAFFNSKSYRQPKITLKRFKSADKDQYFYPTEQRSPRNININLNLNIMQNYRQSLKN